MSENQQPPAPAALPVAPPMTKTRARELAKSSTRYGYFQRSRTQSYVGCPLRCGRDVESTYFPTADVIRSESRQLAARMRALHSEVTTHLLEDCVAAGTAS